MGRQAKMQTHLPERWGGDVGSSQNEGRVPYAIFISMSTPLEISPDVTSGLSSSPLVGGRRISNGVNPCLIAGFVLCHLDFNIDAGR